MNPELKQRLIGAAVVTALATIFIPMLFDDPVDNSGQSVTELSIPPTPVKSTATSVNPATNKLAKTPNAAKTEPTNPEEEPTDAVADAEMLDDADAEATAEPPVNETTPTQPDVATVGQPIAEEEEPEPLDTGVIPEAKTPVKKPNTAKAVETETVAKVNPPVKKPEANTVKVAPVTTKPTNKKPEVNVIKPVPANPTAAAGASEKPAKPAELVRYTIHAGSFAQKDNATALMKTLREQGLPVVMETISSSGKTMYRLKIGPELDKKKATANKAKLDKQGVTNVMFPE